VCLIQHLVYKLKMFSHHASVLSSEVDEVGDLTQGNDDITANA